MCLCYFGTLTLIAGVSETVVLNMSTLDWSIVTTVQGRVPLASEVFNVLHVVLFFKQRTSLFFQQLSIWLGYKVFTCSIILMIN